MSERLENETREAWVARQRKEQNVRLKRKFIPSKGINRKQRRDLDKSIPHDHLIILAKVAEIAGDEMPLIALKLFYNKRTTDRKEMIKNLGKLLKEENSTEKVQADSLK
jgi:hypothetical protein